MKVEFQESPREFEVGDDSILDYGKIHFQDGDMITLVSSSGKECDVTARDWGFYLAPSLNARLRTQGFKVSLVRNNKGKLFLNAVDINKIELFFSYLREQNSEVICWLDEEKIDIISGEEVD